MATAVSPNRPPPNAEEWLRALGNIPLHRIVIDPAPGTATVDDLVRLVEGDSKRMVELVNGTLVQKPMGLRESIIAGILITLLNNIVRPRRLGVVSGEAGMIRMLMGNVRMPDVAFFRREDLPGGELPRDPAPQLAPALAVEVLSKSNTEEEMRIKVREYFQNRIRFVWILDPDPQTLRIYDAPDRFRQLTREDTLTCEELLPGFSVRVGELFEI
ncbi:MAG: hypothetical protein JWP03_3025 [Phycisphaerales bacterium]|jgi:Uma2 family endonuclease|nr:hypothetical protein [Phycisphaerales bacterium]